MRNREDFVCYKDVLEYTGGDTKDGRKCYREFVEEGLLSDEDKIFVTV